MPTEESRQSIKMLWWSVKHCTQVKKKIETEIFLLDKNKIWDYKVKNNLKAMERQKLRCWESSDIKRSLLSKSDLSKLL